MSQDYPEPIHPKQQEVCERIVKEGLSLGRWITNKLNEMETAVLGKLGGLNLTIVYTLAQEINDMLNSHEADQCSPDWVNSCISLMDKIIVTFTKPQPGDDPLHFGSIVSAEFVRATQRSNYLDARFFEELDRTLTRNTQVVLYKFAGILDRAERLKRVAITYFMDNNKPNKSKMNCKICNRVTNLVDSHSRTPFCSQMCQLEAYCV